MNISDVARIWQQAGVSVLPILPNGTKRPAVRWASYQTQPPTLGQVDLWWSNGHEYGLALVCGSVSGNLEMLELEGRATDVASLDRVMVAFEQVGGRDIWDYLNGPEGYVEWSPSGGLHYLYRLSDHPVPGNEKVARDEGHLVLAETRGEGGYVITAPTSGLCHPTGEPWTLVMGHFGVLPTLTWEQRQLLHRALRLALDFEPAPAPVAAAVLPGVAVGHGAGVTPGDDFEARTDWAEILEPHGWQLESRHGNERHWTRPGKSPRDGASATTGRARDRDRLYVFSTSTVFAPEQSYTKFGAFAVLNFNGDYAAAARQLVALGYGERPNPAEGIIPPGISLSPPSAGSPKAYSLDEVGNAQRLYDRVKGRFHYVAEEKQVIRWDGRTWVEDYDGALWREAVACTDEMARTAQATDDESLARWAKSSRSRAKLSAATEMVTKVAGMTLRAGTLNPHRHLLNMTNGVLNLYTRELVPHDPALLMTRMFGTGYDPQATCPSFEQFMVDVLPDPQVRGYVQRALGYSLLGEVDQRALFLVYGPPSTGKSTLMDTIRSLFGDYGATAASGTFRARRDAGPTNDLHDLRGKRFVTTSETAENATYDEDTLKRLTGRDRIRTRELYQSNQEWTPECAIWIATNHPPKFTSDDDAMWRRAKLVPFRTEFHGKAEISDMARRVLEPELPGILSWLLAGLADYLARGLDEPDEIAAAALEQRRQVDSVARFLDDKLADGVLIEEPEALIRTTDLHAIYLEWARFSGEHGLGSRRFNNRLESIKPVRHVRVNGQAMWKGITRSRYASVLGTMMTYLPDS